MGQVGSGVQGEHPLSLDTSAEPWCHLLPRVCPHLIFTAALWSGHYRPRVWMTKLGPRQEQRAAPGQTQLEPGLETRPPACPSASPLRSWRGHGQGTAPTLRAPFLLPSHRQPPLEMDSDLRVPPPSVLRAESEGTGGIAPPRGTPCSQGSLGWGWPRPCPRTSAPSLDTWPSPHSAPPPTQMWA